MVFVVDLALGSILARLLALDRSSIIPRQARTYLKRLGAIYQKSRYRNQFLECRNVEEKNHEIQILEYNFFDVLENLVSRILK